MIAVWIVVAFAAGFYFGIVLMALMAAAGREKDQ